VQLADTQPFLAEDGSFAFCHNGLLDRHDEHRDRLGPSLAGEADSEVGFRMTQEALAGGAAPPEALASVHDQLGGRANFGYLGADGELTVFAVNATNHLWQFGLAGARVAATALHSDDRSVFGMLFERAEAPVVVEGPAVVAPGANGPAAG
jgi:predicted glutamine amidotransferase